VPAGSRNVRGHLALFGGHVLWRVVGLAAGAIGYAAEAGFELEMRRVALRGALEYGNGRQGLAPHLPAPASNNDGSATMTLGATSPVRVATNGVR
jgi:hypothetical protein